MPQLLPFYLMNTVSVLAIVICLLILIATNTSIHIGLTLLIRKLLAV